MPGVLTAWGVWVRGVRRACVCLLKIYLFVFREGGREGERETQKYRCERETSIGCLSVAHTRPGTEPGMYPDRGQNQRSFALWDHAQPTEPHGSGREPVFLKKLPSDINAADQTLGSNHLEDPAPFGSRGSHPAGTPQANT